MHRLKPPASPTSLLLRDAWKYGMGVGITALLLMAGGVERVPSHPHVLASNVLPTTVPCGEIATDPLDPQTATWTATRSPYGTGSPYNLPVNATNNLDPNVTPCPAIIVPANVTLKIDASQGAVQIFSHGAAIKVDGGHLLVLGTSETNSALFDAEPDVASWDGIIVTAKDSTHRGNASLAFASIQHALNSITISSGATSTPNPTNLSVQLPYGLALVNSGIGPSYFDGIDATNTPVLVQGQADSVKHRADGKFGTVNNIGSQGINLMFDGSAPAVTEALHVDSVAFGSSVPFAATGCLPLQLPCSAGFIGNDAILATFTSANPPPVFINQSRFYRAGSFGIELNSPNQPVITDNNFDCNGTGSPKPTETCVGTGLKFSAIYLNNATADLGNSVTNNVGHEDGLDAIAFNGTIAYAPGKPQTLTWINATNDAASDHALGYLLNGDLNLTGGKLVVRTGDVVKSKGTINLTGAALDASDARDSRIKVFTSLRDNASIPDTTNIVSCPSVFVQACPSPLPAGEWGGINLVGSATNATMRNATKATINNAAIRYATTGVHILNGDSLVITGGATGSAIGPTFADGVLAEGTPIAVTGTTFGCPAGVCSGPSSGNHGILADFRNAGPLVGGLKIGGPNTDKNTFQGSVNEAIRGVGLAGQTVDIENNEIQNAGAIGSAGSAGIYLQGADNLTLQRNSVVGSGTGTTHYPAVWLDGVSNADFSGPIHDNTGSGNGLNGIAFHGDTSALTWQTVGVTGPLGFIVDGNLLVAGDLTLANGDYAPVLGGTITVQNGTLTSTGATVTSLKEQTANLPSCGSVFVPRISGVCAPKSAGDWGGLVLDPGKTNRLTASAIRYAVTGISMSTPTGSRLTQNLILKDTSITNTSSDGLRTRSPVSISGGVFSNNGGRGIKIDLTGVAANANQDVTITGPTVSGSGQDGILVLGLGRVLGLGGGHTVQLRDASVDHAGAFGINLIGADNLTLLTLTNNIVTNSAATFPAIYLNGFSGLFANITDNKGAGNGVDAIAFHGTVTDGLTWRTARKTSDPTRLLGYVLDNTLTMQSPDPSNPNTLTVNAGDIVKVGNGGVLNLQGVNLKGDDTGNSSQKVFTSLTDDSAGVATCHSALVTGCTGAAHAGDWGGISLTGSDANGALVNAAIRFAATGIMITSEASSTSGSSIFGLVVSRSSIGPSSGDGINAVKTPISVTNSTISGGTHGISVDYSGATPKPLRLSGNRFMSTSAEAILGQALSGQPVWITDNHVEGAGTFGIRLLSADQLVLRNNNISGSGGGPAAGSGRYPAVYLNAVNADFTRNVRGNVGSSNGLDAIVMDGRVSGSMSWVTPSNQPATHPLGYLLDGGLTLDGGDLTVRAGDVVKALGGPITLNGGSLVANGPGLATRIFTSLKDDPEHPVTAEDLATAAAVSCPSIVAPICSPAAGDWGGLVLTHDSAGNRGDNRITNGLINYADTGISIDSGPIASGEATDFRLRVNGGAILHSSKDAVNALDTPIYLDGTVIDGAGGRGVIASFFSPANCATPAPPCSRLNLTNLTISHTGKDGIIANGLADQPITVSYNTITSAGTYGIRLVGADQLTLVNNTVNTSGIATNAYPAIYLNSVSGDFNTAITGNRGAGNGLNALVFHGTVNTTALHPDFTWLTPDPSGVNPLGYMLDDGLTVNGNFTSTGGVVKVLRGAIKITGALTSIETTYTSMKENGAPFACHTVFVPAACPVPVAASDYWGGVTVNATATSTFTGGGIRFATTGLVVNGPLNVSGASIHDVSGTAVDTSGGTLTIDCSSIRGNGIGVSAGPSATITQSDVFDNTTYDLVAPAGASATYDWWGAGGGKFGTTPASVVSNKLTSQQPVGTLTLADDVLTATNAFAIGNMTLTADFSRKMTKDPTTPLAQFAQAGDPPPPHSLTGHWATDQQWTADPYALNLATASEGKNTLTVSGARSCVPDPSTNLMTLASQDFTAAIEPTSLSVAPASATYGGTTTLSATLTDPGLPLANGKVNFAVNGTPAGSQNTNSLGTAVVNNVSVAGINAGTHSNYVVATYGGDDTFSPSSATGDLTIGKAPLTVTGDPQSRAFGAANPTLTVTPTGLVSPDTNLASIALSPTVSTTATTSSPVGTYPISVIGPATTANYMVTYNDGTLTVTAATVTVTADNQSRAFGDANPPLTASVSGLVGSDTLSSIGVVLTFGTTATTSSLAGNYSISVSGTSPSTANYTVTYVPGTLTVTADVPDAPTGATATPGSSQATVTWTAPATDGGSPITSYTVTSSPDGKTATTLNGSTLTATVTGLTPGTAYTFTVVATNAAGDGPASTASNAVTPYTLPGAPTGATATAGSSEATVTWTTPASDGGNGISKYTVTSSPGNLSVATLNGSTLTATLTGLTPGTAYTFTVVATNAAGDGPASTASNAVTPYTLPGAPTGATATAGSSEATVTWTAPASDGGNGISKYTVTSSPGNLSVATSNGSTLTATLTGLTPGTAYTFTVVATNAAGDGPASTASNTVTPYTLPGAPTGVSGQPGNGDAVVTWTAPATDGGSPITSYTVTSSPDGKTATSLDGSTLTATVSGLTNGTAYTFTVVASNAAGDSVASAASVAITVGAPAAPGSVTAVAGIGEATVSWSLPSDNGSAIDHFTVTPYDGTTAGTPVSVLGPSATSVLVTGLTSGTTYTFQVTATNVLGTSPPGISSGVAIN